MTRNLSGLLAPAAAVLLVAVVVAAVAGAWPPFVAVESGSMAPEVERGDLVVVTSTDRFPWGGLVGAAEPGAPTRFGSAGDVIVFNPPSDGQRPIMHRIAFPVTAGEDWTDRADPALLEGDCSTIAACPAPYDGFVTYGDANGEYDQSAGIAPIVREEWVTAKALFAVPNLGWFRVGVDAAIARVGFLPTAVGFGGLAAATGGFGALLLGRITVWRERRDHPGRLDRDERDR
ncbi:S26 family signal peptidase [Halorubrum halophilum]|uniref:S26 family signal peptidase n=1 Tax=Halorubrum halophilum TaxID=413816 RepID=UPI00067873A4|nr:S26 family signal peptidase [Halorubrum halophilum]